MLSGNPAVRFGDEPACEKALSVIDRLRATITTIAVGCSESGKMAATVNLHQQEHLFLERP